MYIKEIRIRNFRSIVKADIFLNDVSIFVGLNDVGKSNVLKALNLFFNSETDYAKPLNFQEDYSKYAPYRNKKAEEITVELIIDAPKNYKGSKDIKWTKVWRKSGLDRDLVIFADGTNFPRKSKLYAWLKNVRFTYVPAIRGTSYFEILLAKLHDTLAETIESELRSAGDDFIQKIKTNTGEMISEISSRLKIESQIRFPSNLQALFKTLDFSTVDGTIDITLANRGDGVKTRHIPAILKFISDQLNRNKTKGSANVNMIWGYEEPENNLEMLATFTLAEQFHEYSSDIQLLLTTHSPGFYTLKNKYPESTTLFKISKPIGGEAHISIMQNSESLDEDLGVMPLIAPYIQDKITEIQKLKADVIAVQTKIAHIHSNILFVEGKDEIRIYEKLIEHFGNGILLVVKQEALGCSAVKEELMAWSWASGSSDYKAVGIFDFDKSGKSELKKLKAEQQYISAESKGRVKGINYTVPNHLRNIKSKLPNFPIELEEMYSPNIWKNIRSKGLLENRDTQEVVSFISLDSLTQTFAEKIDQLGFTDDEKIYIFSKVPDKHKDKVSKMLIKFPKTYLKRELSELVNFLESKIFTFIRR